MCPISHRAIIAEQSHPATQPSPPFLPLHLHRPDTQLKHQRSPLRLLIASQLKMLAALETKLGLGFAVRAFQPQDHLLGRLCLFVEDGFRLAAVARLFAVVAALSLCD